jgi:hypothetical protein
VTLPNPGPTTFHFVKDQAAPDQALFSPGYLFWRQVIKLKKKELWFLVASRVWRYNWPNTKSEEASSL